MSKIQKIPWGLLDGLGIKSSGQNPIDLLDGVRPSVDLRDFYTVNDIESVSAVESGISPSVGSTRSTIDVPQGEAWWVRSVGTVVENASGTTNSGKCSPYIRLGGVGRGIRLVKPTHEDIGTSEDDNNVAFPNWLIPPGSELGTVVGRTITTITVQIVTEATIVRFRV